MHRVRKLKKRSMIRELFCTKQIPEDRHVKGKERKKKSHISDRVFNHSTRCRNLGSSRYALQHDSPPPHSATPLCTIHSYHRRRADTSLDHKKYEEIRNPKLRDGVRGLSLVKLVEPIISACSTATSDPKQNQQTPPPQLHRPSLTQCK